MINETLASNGDVTSGYEIKHEVGCSVSVEKPATATVEIQTKIVGADDSTYRTIRTMEAESESANLVGPLMIRAKVTAGAPALVIIRKGNQ